MRLENTMRRGETKRRDHDAGDDSIPARELLRLFRHDAFAEAVSPAGTVRPPAGLASSDELELWPSDLPHEVTRDPSNSNYDGSLGADDVADADGDGDHDVDDVKATMADPAWRAEVDAARAALSAEDRAKYDDIAAEIAHDPRAALALEEMLVDGELLEGTNAEGEDLLTALHGGTGSGGPNDWLADLVQEVADPQTISQGATNTCGATSIATYLATNDPAEYARLVVGLAVDGEVVTRDGTRMVADDRVDDKLASLADNNRPSYGAFLLIEALMEISVPGMEYDPIRDGHETLFGLITTPGTLPDEFALAFAAVTGQPAEWRMFGLIHRDEEFQALADAVAGGATVPAMISYNGSLHWVLVTGIDADGTVHYVNPWGREETAAREDFQQNLMGTVYLR